MDGQGVILYADDHIFVNNKNENKLYMKLIKDFPVLGVDSIEMAEKAIKSIGTFSALILDWQFKQGEVEGISLPDKTPEALLLNRDFYSLIYIFSNFAIPNDTKKKLKRKFPGRVHFKRKTANTVQDFKDIKKDLKDWKKKNKKTVVALNWSNTINQSVQKIFSELTRADVNWIHDLYKSAATDVSPEIEVVNLLQSILSEQLITNKALLQSISKLKDENKASKANRGRATSKLARRLYYTKLDSFTFEEVPIMTGDVFVFDKKKTKYGVVITPECDIRHKKGKNSEYFELLTFERKMAKTIMKNDIRPNIKSLKRGDFYKAINDITGTSLTNNQKIEIGKILNQHESNQIESLYKNALNQDHKRLHLLPSFYFTDRKVNEMAVIDFRNSVRLESGEDLQKLEVKRVCKINSPFIQELRQRYLSYVGRVGVPAPFESVKEQNIIPLL